MGGGIEGGVRSGVGQCALILVTGLALMHIQEGGSKACEGTCVPTAGVLMSCEGA